jgi:hypothetical protein
MEGQTVLSKLDVIAKVGPKTAYDVTLPVTLTDGTLNPYEVSLCQETHDP